MQTHERLLLLRGHTSWVTACIFSPSGDAIISSSTDRPVKVWDTISGEARLTLYGHTDCVNSCTISSAGDYIVSVGDDIILKV
ncbi:MAG: WD40 repeat domain-containing protein [Ktedonobacteraceae bacterium]